MTVGQLMEHLDKLRTDCRIYHLSGGRLSCLNLYALKGEDLEAGMTIDLTSGDCPAPEELFIAISEDS